MIFVAYKQFKEAAKIRGVSRFRVWKNDADCPEIRPGFPGKNKILSLVLCFVLMTLVVKNGRYFWPMHSAVAYVLTSCLSFFFFPARCTFENINPYPSKFLTSKIKVQLGKTRSKRQRGKQCKTERFSKADQIFVEFCLRCFDTVSRRPDRSFSIAFKVILSLSDRHKIFTCELKFVKIQFLVKWISIWQQ